DFISYDDSILILNEGLKPKERYFCLSFDDGFKNIFQNVIEIFLRDKIPCTFFIPTSFINNLRPDSGKVFFNRKDISIEFLSWSDCKKIVSEKIFDIGSHSINHKLISKLPLKECVYEVQNSKKIIENELNIQCNHFAPPVGDYSVNRDLEIVKNSNFISLSSTIRGKMDNLENDVFALKRHHLLANWELDYLKYFFFK
ncbi:polysaccharide deacetylase family protein, partial [Candidatus Pelagibacter sp.]|nr:polysaccharide deacetylase family protein [Candidatus Pelagibacter sp.]